jgi:hypothetical protein
MKNFHPGITATCQRLKRLNNKQRDYLYLNNFLVYFSQALYGIRDSLLSAVTARISLKPGGSIPARRKVREVCFFASVPVFPASPIILSGRLKPTCPASAI